MFAEVVPTFNSSHKFMKTLIPILLAILLIPLFIWIFYRVRKESKKLVIKTFRELESEGIPDLKCPKCHVYMDVGFTVAGRGLMFRRRYEEFKYIAADRLVTNTANLGFSMKENLSWRCDHCKLIMVDYSCQIIKSSS